MKPMPLVSISINQSIPLRDALYELAQQANYDVELDPNISGSIIYSAHERPFDEVVSRIAELGGLRYKFNNNVMHVEVDTPYNQTYQISYLSYIRKNKGGIHNNVSVVSGNGADTGSTYEATSDSEADFWGELEQNLKQQLGGSVSGALKTTKTPKISAAEQNPQAAASSAGASATTPAGGVASPQATLKVESLPTEDDSSDKTAGGTSSSGTASADSATFTINKQAGLVSVYANEKTQHQVEAYLKLLKKMVTAQVQIEAKVLEVQLDDDYSTGIDWRAINLFGGRLQTLNFVNTAGVTGLNALGPSTIGSSTGAITNSAFTLGYAGNDLQALASAISSFGNVRALSSPRLTVLNNQSAVLNVANNHVYFSVKVNVTQPTTTTPGTTDISSDVHSVPVGVLLNVQPSINLQNNTISLALRPTVTRITAEVPDPAIQYITAQNNIKGIVSNVPELNVQEVDSVAMVRSGEPIVLGGMMQDRADFQSEGIPVLGESPIIGALFRKHTDQVIKTELVIFLKATILDAPADSVDDTDKDIYRGFSSDRHPIKL